MFGLLAMRHGKAKQPLGQAGRRHQQCRFFDQIACPADALAEQAQQMDGQIRFAAQNFQQILSAQRDQLSRFHRYGARSSCQAVDYGDFAEALIRLHDVQEDLLARGADRADSHAPGNHAKQRITRVALSKDSFVLAKVARDRNGCQAIDDPVR